MGSLSIRVLFVLFAVLLMAGCAGLHTEEIKTMRDMARDSKGQEDALAREEASFQNVRAAILQGWMKPGFSSAKVADSYGLPVSVVIEGSGKRWVYTGKDSGWFQGPKIHLYFDESGRLTHWDMIRME